ncbi:MAG: hypothetical protein J0L82_05865 [Deltaproteobacteria bacterium]|nr:hypothetical protein [Deltaproteobacteria bacterium]
MKLHSKGQLTKKTVSLVTATLAVVVGLSACGKFSAIDPKAKGTSTNANPLAADEENRLRELMASATPTPSPAPGQTPAPDAADADAADRDAALDEARRLFGAELNGAPATGAADPAVAAPAPPAAAAPAPPPVAAADAPTGSSSPGERPATVVQPDPQAQPAPSKALIAADVSDEAKRDLILQLVEPTMRINFVLSLQRNEILALKKVLDSKKELSAEQAAKLSKFKQSFLLVDGDSIEALLSRVDVVNMTLQVAPLLLKTNWQTNGAISQEEISARVQMLNTYPSDQAIRFRSGRLAMKSSNEKKTSTQIMLAELGYNPESGKDEQAEKTLATIEEALRIMDLYSTEIDKKINDTAAKLVSEHGKK